MGLWSLNFICKMLKSMMEGKSKVSGQLLSHSHFQVGCGKWRPPKNEGASPSLFPHWQVSRHRGGSNLVHCLGLEQPAPGHTNLQPYSVYDNVLLFIRRSLLICIDVNSSKTSISCIVSVNSGFFNVGNSPGL